MTSRAEKALKKTKTKAKKSDSKAGGPPYPESVNSPFHQIFSLQQTIGNLAVQRLFVSGKIQAKLKIGAPGDRYEQEADRVAEAVMQMSKREIQGATLSADSPRTTTSALRGQPHIGVRKPIADEEDVVRKKSASPRAFTPKPYKQATTRHEPRPYGYPGRLNYEFQVWPIRVFRKGRWRIKWRLLLIAHTHRRSDIKDIRAFLTILHGYHNSTVPKAKMRAWFRRRQRRKSGQYMAIDLTPLLPKAVEKYMRTIGGFYRKWRRFVRRQGKPVAGGRSRRGLNVERYFEKAPKTPDEMAVTCHHFLTMLLGRHAPGAPKTNLYGAALKSGARNRALRAFKRSISGRGPFQVVSKTDVKIGDIAVFRLAAPLSIAARRFGFKLGDVIHSALVMRVLGKGRKVELLEKKAPRKALATRTVKWVITYYKKKGDNVSVFYLRPRRRVIP